MTQGEWLVCTDVQLMLDFLQNKASDRKLRLLAVACVRQVWHSLSDVESRRATECAEQFADGLVGPKALSVAYRMAAKAWRSIARPWDSTTERPHYFAALAAVRATWSEGWEQGTHRAVQDAAFAAAKSIWAEDDYRQGDDGWRESAVAQKVFEQQSLLVRDVFGDPFDSLSSDSCSVTPIVTNIARAAYEERRLPFGELDAPRLAILADALEDSDCKNAGILSHLRGPGIHVRGCWVVDLCLGKN
jgi:hypothetical protein